VRNEKYKKMHRRRCVSDSFAPKEPLSTVVLVYRFVKRRKILLKLEKGIEVKFVVHGIEDIITKPHP
jgi:hypothetical protein